MAALPPNSAHNRPAAWVALLHGWGGLLILSMVMLGGGILVWHLVLRPTALAAYSGRLESALSLAYPVDDLVLLFAVTALLVRKARAINRGALTWLAAGRLTYFVCNLAFGYLSLHGGYASGHPLAAILMTTLCLWAVSGQDQYVRASQSLNLGASRTVSGPRTSLLRYIALTIGYGLVLVEAPTEWANPLVGSLPLALVGVS